MKLLLKLSLALLMSVSFGKVSFAQGMELEDGDEYFEDGTTTRGCKKVKCLVVCGSANVGGTLTVSGNESVGGNLAVGGSVTGGSFAVSPAAAVGTPGVPGIGGALAWGEGEHTTAQTGPGVVTIDSAGVSSAGITPVLGAAGGLLLALPGIYMFQYYVVNTAAVAATIDLFNLNITTEVPNSLVTNAAAAAGQISGFVIASIATPATTIQLRIVAGAAVTPATGVSAKITATRLA